MCLKSEEFRSIMSDIWLCDPISNRGKQSLTNLQMLISEEEYLKELYVPPFTIFQQEQNIPADEDQDIEKEVSYYSTIQRRELEDEQLEFEQSLVNLDKSLYLISGGPGCGKSTYVHHLKTVEGLQNTMFILCNFENVVQRFNLFNNRFTFPLFYDDNVWKFVAIIVLKISWLLDRFDYRNITDNHLEYLRRIYDCYQNYFFIESPEFVSCDDFDYGINDLDTMEDFFAQLNQYLQHQDRTEFRNSMFNYINSRLDKYKNCERSAYGDRELSQEVAYFSGILIRLFFCLSRIYQEQGKDQKFLMVIDNIESFIKRDQESPIQDCELETIIKGIGLAISDIRPLLMKMQDIYNNRRYSDVGWKEGHYNSFYGFLLVTRLSTISLIECEHYDDFPLEKEINISNWFYIDDIYQRKEDYLKSRIGYLQDNPFYIAFRNVLRDTTPYYWCTHDLLNRMYNNNYRRIGLDLVKTISKQPLNTIEDFNRKWSESNVSGNSAIKHMCRKYIYRILLDNIQQTGFFDELMVEQNGSKRKSGDINIICSANSFARKIATILAREFIDGGSNRAYTNLHFIPLVKLTEELLVPPHMSSYEVTDGQLDNLGRVLFLMNETRYVETHWAPLVNIKYDNEKEYKKQNLISVIKHQWHRYCDNGRCLDSDMQKYGVRITMAGIFFAKMVPEFEYFACRYVPKRPALFVAENLRQVGVDSYNCIELIRTVRENAFLCINEILEKDKRFFEVEEMDYSDYSPLFGPVDHDKILYRWNYHISETKTSSDRKNLKSHPLRILDSHIGYLTNYAQYVESLSEGELSAADKRNICSKLSREIALYKEKRESILIDYAEYFG